MTDRAEKILLRNSERKKYRRCRQAWKWSYLDRYSPIGTKGALAFGTLVHTALEHWYVPGRERGVHPAETFAKEFDSAGNEFGQWDEEGERHDARELGIAMLNNYVDTFGEDSHLEVISPEMPFEIELKEDRSHGRVYLVTLVGTFDLVLLDHNDGRIWLSDHKTAKSIRTDHLELDDQAGTYLLCATTVLRRKGILGKNDEIAGILYNFLRKAKPDERPRDPHGRYLNKPSKDALIEKASSIGIELPKKTKVDVIMCHLEEAGIDPLQLGVPSKNQPPDYFLRQKIYRSKADNRKQVERLRKEAREMNMVRRGELEIYKNPTQDCHWDCDFFDVCIQEETGVDYEETLELMYEEWDPYENHDDRIFEEVDK